MFLLERFKKYIIKYRGGDNLAIDFESLKKIISNEKDSLLIDVRSKQEYNEGHLNGSINISLFDIERGRYRIQNKNTVIILYCSFEKRSRKAAKILKRNGYSNVYYLEGGISNL